MFVLAGLGLYKLVKCRCPDLVPRVHIMLLIMAFIILLVVVGMVSDHIRWLSHIGDLFPFFSSSILYIYPSFFSISSFIPTFLSLSHHPSFLCFLSSSLPSSFLSLSIFPLPSSIPSLPPFFCLPPCTAIFPQCDILLHLFCCPCHHHSDGNSRGLLSLEHMYIQATRF